jgi:hypothetical protein
VRATIEVNFRMVNRNSSDIIRWYVGRAEFHPPPGATRPVVVKGSAPRFSPKAGSATATVEFEIDEKGPAGSLKIEEPSDDEWADRFIPCTMESSKAIIGQLSVQVHALARAICVLKLHRKRSHLVFMRS